MTRFLAAVLLAEATAANPAAAAPLFFDFVATDTAQNVSFTLDGSPRPTVYASTFATFRDIVVSAKTGTFVSSVTFYTPNIGGGLAVAAPGQQSGLVAASGIQIFTGTTADPSFATGVFNLTAFNSSFSAGTLTIKNVTAVVPEPASWAMMIAGFGLVGVTMRRRKVAVTFA